MSSSFTIKYAKKNIDKLTFIKQYINTLHDLANVAEFIALPMKYLEIICKFTEKDWISYGSLVEDEETINDGIFTKNLFETWNTSKKITYDLYRAMREEEINNYSDDEGDE